MKKRIVTGLIVMASLLLTACGLKNNAAPTKTAEPVKITFWHAMNGPYKAALDEIIHDFNQSHPAYHVEGVSQGSYPVLQQKLMAAGKSKTLPTIAQAIYTSVPDYQSQHLIVPIDTYLKDSQIGFSKADLHDIYPVFLKSSQYQGHYYSVPFSKSIRVMYVNQDMLAHYHLKTPISWEEIQKIGPMLKKDQHYTIGFDKSFDIEYYTLAKQLGLEPVTETGKVQVNATKSLQAAHVITDMLADGTAKTAGEDKYFSNRFIQGQSLFYIGSSAGITQMQQQAPQSFHWTTAMTPTYHGQAAAEVGGNDVVMMQGASKAQEKGAWLFMKYLVSRKVTAKWASATNYVPVRQSAIQEADYQRYLKHNPAAQAMVDSLPDAVAAAAFKGANAYQYAMWSTMDNIITKGETPETAFATLQKQAEKIVN